MELLEYVNFNFLQKNDYVVEILEDLMKSLEEDENVKEEYKRTICVASGCAKGYTEYKAKELAKLLGVTKTAIKYMCDTLLEEKKIILIKDRNVTFIKPVIQ